MIYLHFAMVAVLVFCLSVGLDLILADRGVERMELIVASNALAAFGCGGAFAAYQWGKRRHEAERKLRLVGEMNHHVRNALQVITYANSLRVPKDQYDPMVRDAVQRIERALDEVLVEKEGKIP
jgi:hypothetical protein